MSKLTGSDKWVWVSWLSSNSKRLNVCNKNEPEVVLSSSEVQGGSHPYQGPVTSSSIVLSRESLSGRETGFSPDGEANVGKPRSQLKVKSLCSTWEIRIAITKEN